MPLEHKHEPLLSWQLFGRRLLRHGLAAALLVGGALAIGAAGYHWTEGLPWLDAVLNAAMLLGGMGPVGPLETTAGKIFATVYALFAGLVFLTVAAVLFTPVLHRVLHRLHLDEDADA